VFADGTTSKNPEHYLSASVSGSKNAMGLFASSSSGGKLTVARPGSVALTVAPVPGTTENTFQFTSGPDTAAKIISGVQTLTILLESMTPSGSSYSIGFSCSNIALLKAEFIRNKDSEFRHLAIAKPQMSRLVDFSVDDGGKPRYDKDCVAYGESTSNLGKAGVEFDANLGYWVTKTSAGNTEGSGYNRFWNQNIDGDFFLLAEDVGAAPPLAFFYDKSDFGTAGAAADFRYVPGIVRRFTRQCDFPYAKRIGFDLLNTNSAK
jgi:hypothetical protein